MKKIDFSDFLAKKIRFFAFFRLKVQKISQYDVCILKPQKLRKKWYNRQLSTINIEIYTIFYVSQKMQKLSFSNFFN